MRNSISLKLLLFLIIGALNEESTNTQSVIKVTYKEETSYPDGFANRYRTGIKSIVVDGIAYDKNKPLTIEKGQTIEIIFSENNPPKSLRLFFGYVEEWKIGDKNNNKIKSIDFSNFDDSQVTNIDYLFYGCTALEEINFENFQTKGVGNLNHVFENCKSLKSLDLTNIKLIEDGIQQMTQLFYGCSSLEFINMTSFNGKNVNNAELFLRGTKSLKKLILYNAEVSDIFKEELLKSLDKNQNMSVCHDDNKIIDDKDGCATPNAGSPMK